jgi:hypothetical protein
LARKNNSRCRCFGRKITNMDEKELKQALEALKETPDRLNLVYGLVDSNFNKTDALKKIDRSKSWLYAIPPEELEYLIGLAREYNLATKMRALEIINAAVPHAAEVQVKLLDARDDRVKQAAAIQVLDRGVGKVASPVELTGKDGEAIKTTDEGHNRAISKLADALGEIVLGKGAEQDGEMDTTK